METSFSLGKMRFFLGHKLEEKCLPNKLGRFITRNAFQNKTVPYSKMTSPIVRGDKGCESLFLEHMFPLVFSTVNSSLENIQRDRLHPGSLRLLRAQDKHRLNGLAGSRQKSNNKKPNYLKSSNWVSFCGPTWARTRDFLIMSQIL